MLSFSYGYFNQCLNIKSISKPNIKDSMLFLTMGTVSLVLEEAQIVLFMRWFEAMVSVAIHMP